MNTYIAGSADATRYGQLSSAYDALAHQPRAIRDMPALRAVCEEAAAIVARYPAEAYRAAMWERRTHLVAKGEAARAFDGVDAIEWQRNKDKPGASAEAMAAMRARIKKTPDSTLQGGVDVVATAPQTLRGTEMPLWKKDTGQFLIVEAG